MFKLLKHEVSHCDKAPRPIWVPEKSMFELAEKPIDVRCVRHENKS